MVIDLHKCVGCGSCNFTCKIENNVADGVTWAKLHTTTKGSFPDIEYEHIPTLCNHCLNAPCVKACPTQAMHKTDDGLTLHDPDKCIGCTSCMIACPYGIPSFNKVSPSDKWTSDDELIAGCTASGKQTAEKSGAPMPNYNPARDTERYPGMRPGGVVEKCTFCDHRIKENLDPYCVEGCPAGARIFGDISDSKSEAAQLLKKYKPKTLKPEQGTLPQVYYIRDYRAK